MMNSSQQDATELANLIAKAGIEKISITINHAETPWLDFSDTNAAYKLALYYEKEHQYEEACQIYCNLIRIRSSLFQPYKEIQPLKKRWMETCNTTKDQGLINKINFHLAIISLQAEDKQAAIAHLNSFIKNNNEHLQAHYLHAMISSEIVNSLNETQKAQILKNFEHAIKGSPEKLNYHRGKINFCLSQKQYNIAIEDIKRLIQEIMKTTNEIALIRRHFESLVDIYDTGNMVSEAIDYYNKETDTLKKNILHAPLRAFAQKKLATITNDNPYIRKENIMLAMRLYNFLEVPSLKQANSLLLSIKEINSTEEKITLLKEFILQMKKFNKIIKLHQEDNYLEKIISEAEDYQKKLNEQPSDEKQENNDFDFLKHINADQNKLISYDSLLHNMKEMLNPLSIEKWTKKINTKPEPRLYGNRGIAYLLLEKYDEAIADLTRATQIEVSDNQPINEINTLPLRFNNDSAAYCLAVAYERKNDYKNACNIYCNLIRYDYNHKKNISDKWTNAANEATNQKIIDDINYYHAIILMQDRMEHRDGSRRKANEHLTKFINHNEQHPEGRYLRAHLDIEHVTPIMQVHHLSPAEIDRIINDLTCAINHNPTNLHYRQERMEFCIRVKQRLDLALEDAKERIKAKAENVSSNVWLSADLASLAKIYVASNNLEGAIQYGNTNLLNKFSLLKATYNNALARETYDKVKNITNKQTTANEENIKFVIDAMNRIGADSDLKQVYVEWLLASIKTLKSKTKQLALLSDCLDNKTRLGDFISCGSTKKLAEIHNYLALLKKEKNTLPLTLFPKNQDTTKNVHLSAADAERDIIYSFNYEVKSIKGLDFNIEKDNQSDANAVQQLVQLIKKYEKQDSTGWLFEKITSYFYQNILKLDSQDELFSILITSHKKLNSSLKEKHIIDHFHSAASGIGTIGITKPVKKEDVQTFIQLVSYFEQYDKTGQLFSVIIRAYFSENALDSSEKSQLFPLLLTAHKRYSQYISKDNNSAHLFVVHQTMHYMLTVYIATFAGKDLVEELKKRNSYFVCNPVTPINERQDLRIEFLQNIDFFFNSEKLTIDIIDNFLRVFENRLSRMIFSHGYKVEDMAEEIDNAIRTLRLKRDLLEFNSKSKTTISFRPENTRYIISIFKNINENSSSFANKCGKEYVDHDDSIFNLNDEKHNHGFEL